MGKGFNLQKPSSWPKEVQSFLRTNAPFYREWFRKRKVGELTHWQSVALAERHDALHTELQEILQPHYLTGYHCTRLTEVEIEEVRATGLLPSSPAMLTQRIRRLPIPTPIQERLCSENQAADGNRKGMIWFCLFPPIQESFGVKRFFQSWGGEALYNSHERDPETGPVLQQIGIPCVVEIKVSVSTMRHQFFVADILKHHFKQERGRLKQEDFSVNPLAASCIVKIHQHPSTSFAKLTGWDGACD